MDLKSSHEQGVIAVIVSRNREIDLENAVNAVKNQKTSEPLRIIIVDSSDDDNIYLKYQNTDRVNVYRSVSNIGGAGGFAFGLLLALTAGARWIWLMDDDGRPATTDVLETLLNVAQERRLDAIAPAVVDPNRPEIFAFPYPVRSRYIFKVDDIKSDFFLQGTAHLFNGILLRSDIVLKVGLPDVRLFIRGDEVDFLFRLRDSRVQFGTTFLTKFFHPSSKEDLVPVFWGRLHIVYPRATWKRRIQYRNRGYNFIKNKKYILIFVDFLRYPYFFIIKKRGDFSGLSEWLYFMWRGMRGKIELETGAD